MVKRINYASNLNTSKDIYKKNDKNDNPKSVYSNSMFCCRYLLEFVDNISLNIGEYIYIDKQKYPQIHKKKGERVYAFVDNSRNGFCYDECFDNMKITMFIHKNCVIIV